MKYIQYSTLWEYLVIKTSHILDRQWWTVSACNCTCVMITHNWFLTVSFVDNISCLWCIVILTYISISITHSLEDISFNIQCSRSTFDFLMFFKVEFPLYSEKLIKKMKDCFLCEDWYNDQACSYLLRVREEIKISQSCLVTNGYSVVYSSHQSVTQNYIQTHFSEPEFNSKTSQ